jgi:hypothetical protein
MSKSQEMRDRREQDAALQRRLLAKDPVATAELANDFLGKLVQWLRGRNRNVDEHLCREAAEDAILALIDNPHSYQPAKQSLERYLRMSARGDLLNILQREKKHRDKRVPWNVVELADEAGNYIGIEDPSPAVDADCDTETIRRTTIVEREAKQLSESDQRVLELMRRGERRTSVFAVAMGISHLPVAEQKREVKRAKDRLKKRLQRGEQP